MENGGNFLCPKICVKDTLYPTTAVIWKTEILMILGGNFVFQSTSFIKGNCSLHLFKCSLNTVGMTFFFLPLLILFWRAPPWILNAPFVRVKQKSEIAFHLILKIILYPPSLFKICEATDLRLYFVTENQWEKYSRIKSLNSTAWWTSETPMWYFLKLVF